MKEWQEFFCTKSGGGCGGYILVRLNMSINHVAEIVCPKCGHKHQRSIVGGQIREDGRHRTGPKEEICPPLSAWSKKSKVDHLLKERDAAKIDDNDAARIFVRQSWMEKFAGKLTGR
jgi:hypothetical protein